MNLMKMRPFMLLVSCLISTQVSASDTALLDAACFHYDDHGTVVAGSEYVGLAKKFSGHTLQLAAENGVVNFQLSQPSPEFAALYLTSPSGQNSLVSFRKRYVKKVHSNVYVMELKWFVTNAYYQQEQFSSCHVVDSDLISGRSVPVYVWPANANATYLRYILLK